MLLDQPIIAFDIETMPDPDIGRRLLGMEGDDSAVVHAMVQKRLQETDNQTEYPSPPWHRVVAICVCMLGPKSGRAEIRALGSGLNDERAMLEAFFALFKHEDRTPRLVSWNGSGFDLPVMRYRAMLHGVAAPNLYRADGDFRFNNYQNRYHDMHLDLMDVLTGYGASQRISLDNWCRTVGLPGKGFLDRPVYEHVLNGEMSRVVEYCKLDTVETLLAFLLFAHHRGDLNGPELRRYIDAVREAMTTQAYDGWREIEKALAGWPKWLADGSDREPEREP